MYTNVDQQGLKGLFRDIVHSRGLLWDLISKELRARYRNAVMGFVWAVLQPLLMMLILYFVFGVVFAERVGMDDARAHEPPRPVPLLCGLIFWQFFAASLTRASVSLIENADLIKKVYFPREVLPLSVIGNSFVNLCIGFVVLAVLHLALGGGLGLGLFWVAVVLAIEMILVIGLAQLVSCLNVYYRDVGYGVEVLLTFGFYATPIFYPLSLVQERAPEWLYRLYLLNPMAGIVSALRQAFVLNHTPDLTLMAWPAACALLLLAAGIAVFRRASPTIADHL